MDRLTALGSLEEIPANIDVLVAGTPCVDFSSLNGSKERDFTRDVGEKLQKLFQSYDKTDQRRNSLLISGVKNWLEHECLGRLKDQGESSGAFFAMLSYARINRPRAILLENVQNAPWNHIADVWFPSIGYEAGFIRVDSKDFYIPQTRSRGYLLAIDSRRFNGNMSIAAEIIDCWLTDFKGMKRRASVPIDHWLLPSTDPLTELARQDEEAKLLDRRCREKISWTQSRRRHVRVRREKDLGESRPLTNWTEGGGSRPHDRMDKILMNGQPSRVLDCIDIYYLHGVKNGYQRANGEKFFYDNMFKTRVLDLSQNVDRHVDGVPFGLIGCVTPMGIPYITDQARILTGYEALKLQGLPLHRITFSREDQDQLRDLAGNAMTTTVVGAALLALFTSVQSVCKNRLFKKATPSIPSTNSKLLSSDDAMSIPDELLVDEANFASKCRLDKTKPSIPELVKNLRRYCYCNGVAKYSTNQFKECRNCGTIRCVWCAGNPPHAFRDITGPTSPRLPDEAAIEVMSILPSIIKRIINLPILSEAACSKLPGIFTRIRASLHNAVFYYDHIHVTEVITVCYAAPEFFQLRATLSESGIT